MIRENEYRASPGLSTLLVALVALVLLALGFLNGVGNGRPFLAILAMILIVVVAIASAGFFTVNPGEAKVLQLLGVYKGTVRQQGFWYANPFVTKKTISLRIRNFETTKLKVNDNRANPIEIAAIVVWKVVDTAEALFEVDNYVTYVAVQSESAVRAVAQSYPYDSHADTEEALSTHTAEVSLALQKAIEERLAKAGVEVVEARISHLAYSPEIAQAMLQRQQAGAIIAARSKIVEGAVGMVEHALAMLSSKGIVTLDEERKAQMVSNLLVVLCSERAASPVVNAGSIFG
ncbi:MAG: SPFH domain-containing protein [Gemmatimonadaceae bacterium]|nr:SPFH domain-containing protein [Gemmatimonadaceae bacterium]NUO94364.1 SPFH domain-containing protein [Gemmatimonadaceae bacterium]NUR35194.1 SPFH domain-containing protein [Gemmatimonadaceae bacterium]NUS48884.1 SPFH domain-containing protein [Gemmatimonadaceae bacterium]